MRKILRALMTASGETALHLEARSGIPQPTTYRFLSATHGRPRMATIRKWAQAYGVTEAQLRGEEPIPGLTDPLVGEGLEEDPGAAQRRASRSEQRAAARMARRAAIKKEARGELMLAAEKRELLALMNNMSEEARKALLQIARILMRLQQENRTQPERETPVVNPDPVTRRPCGKTFHDPVVKSQLRQSEGAGMRRIKKA